MAARKNDTPSTADSTPDPAPIEQSVEQQTPPPLQPEPPLPQSRVRPREYATGKGWEVGDHAPSDAYRRIGQYGEPIGPVTFEHPGGKATRVAVAGVPITEATHRDLTRGVEDEQD